MGEHDERWATPTQYGCIESGLRVLTAWVVADDDPEGALDRAIRQEPDPAGTLVGSAVVARLLAIELAAATGTTEQTVLADLTATVCLLQHPIPATPPPFTGGRPDLQRR